MIPPFDAAGLLPPGVHCASWDQLSDRFANNAWREMLMTGFKAALENLKRAGCRTVYLNGSFVTNKSVRTTMMPAGRKPASTRRSLTPSF